MKSSSTSIRPADASDPAAQAVVLTIYFDGGCPVCTREIALLRRQAGAETCEWIDAATCPEAELGPGLNRPIALARFHVRAADGSLVSGIRAFALLWQTLPSIRWLGRLAGAGPMPVLLEVAYSGFLRLRRLWRPARVCRSAAEGGRC